MYIYTFASILSLLLQSIKEDKKKTSQIFLSPREKEKKFNSSIAFLVSLEKIKSDLFGHKF